MKTSSSTSLLEKTFLENNALPNLLSFDEYRKLREMFGAKENYYVKKLFKNLKEQSLLSKNELYLMAKSNLRDLAIECRFERSEFKTYVVFNMLFGRIPIIREFIFINLYRSPSVIRKSAMYFFYEQNRPHYFPKLEEFYDPKERLLYFFISLVLFYSPEELNDEAVVEELENHLGKKIFKHLSGNRMDRLKQFINIAGPTFISNGILTQRENLLEYLYRRISGQEILSEKEKIWKSFHIKMEKHKNTEFYSTLKFQLKEYLLKGSAAFTTLDYKIRVWAHFTEFVVEQGCENLRDITPLHRDLYIDEYLYEISIQDYFNHIKLTIRNYNQEKFGDRIDQYINESIFSSKHIPKKPKDSKHITYMESAYAALVSSIASEIHSTRKEFSELTEGGLRNFFLSRLIWLIFLTGARVTEVRKMELNNVKSTLLYKEPYIIIKTLKDNEDRIFELYRGEDIDGRYQNDIVHIEILNEVIEKAEKLYSSMSLPIVEKPLFPNRFLSYFKYDVIRNYFRDIQLKNAIICGSHYDIMQRDFYNSYPEMKRKMEVPSALFGLHEIRHMHIDKLVLYGMSNQIEISKNIGHKNKVSQEVYKKAAFGVMEVAKLMGKNEHYGAANKLVPSVAFIVDDEKMEREEILLTEDIEKYLNEIELKGVSNEEAINNIDENTLCNTTISCGETGFGCLGCNDFISGKATHDAIINTSVLLEHQIKTIDFEITRLNDKQMLKKQYFINFQMLLMTILERFEGIEFAKQRTFMAQENFNWSLEQSETFIKRLMKRCRQVEVEKEVIKYIISKRDSGDLNEEVVSRLHFLTSRNNKKVFG